ncbi:MAG: bifunctional phosphopantothenoylcysteine decarboxylase/phosphopantothenate--cysteine ligase CoaBC [Armatimonadetes bacterium]|nr:bifunctional phosphopantothenoylcysteine decarboxylase/phosphopantothenate--cysteine ligase CoaBC [Armatimonadota bacterium]
MAGKTIILGVTGSIAAYKAAEIASSLVKMGADVHVIMTEAACRLVGSATFRALTRNPVLLDVFDEPQSGEIAHVALPEKADLMLIAPATANIIGKIANGIADDMLTTAALVARCPVLIAPAMNSRMYTNAVVIGNMDRLKNLGWNFIEPGAGWLACGEEGVGRLADLSTIVSAVVAVLHGGKKDYVGIKLLVTAGPTREPVDPVRFVSNYSSGKMGYAIAEAAAERGGIVTMVSGPTDLPDPPGVNVIRVQTAKEMLDAVIDNLLPADIIISAAAVADYRPVEKADQKLKKEQGWLRLELERTEDILRRIGEMKGSKILIGFAAETENIEENARRKLLEKNLDLVVANDVSEPGGAFGSDTNIVTLIPREGEPQNWPRMSKREIAHAILDYVITHLWEAPI